MAQALLTAPGASLYAVLADLAGVPGNRSTKLSRSQPNPRMGSLELAERNLQAIVSRHKPGTTETYYDGRRLALRWLQREGRTTIDDSCVSQLFVDLIDAGYSAETLRCVHNSVKEVAEALGLSAYGRAPGFVNAYHGFLRSAERQHGKRPHSPIDRTMWQQLLSAAEREVDRPLLLRALHLGFGMFFRIGEARATRDRHVCAEQRGRPWVSCWTCPATAPFSRRIVVRKVLAFAARRRLLFVSTRLRSAVLRQSVSFRSNFLRRSV